MRARGSVEVDIKTCFYRVLKSNPVEHKLLEKMLDLLREQKQDARKSEMITRMILESHEKCRLGWFVVYNTLTIRDDEFAQVFREKGAWSRYIKKITIAVGSALTGSKKSYISSGIRATDIHSYASVLERGTKGTERLHIYVLHYIKILPKRASDPNKGVALPIKRQINCFRRYWPHGFSTPIAVRYSANDAYGKAGWIWPLKKKGGKLTAVPAKPVYALALYLGKYLNKTLHKESDEIWKTKTSRDFGEAIMRQACEMMSDQSLRTLSRIPQTQTLLPTINGSPLPVIKLRRIALQQLLMRQNVNSTNLKLNASMVAIVPQEPLLKRLKRELSETASSTWEPSNLQNTTSTGIWSLNAADISEASDCIRYVFKRYDVNKIVYSGTGRSEYD